MFSLLRRVLYWNDDLINQLSYKHSFWALNVWCFYSKCHFVDSFMHVTSVLINWYPIFFHQEKIGIILTLAIRGGDIGKEIALCRLWFNLHKHWDVSLVISTHISGEINNSFFFILLTLCWRPFGCATCRYKTTI